MTENRFKYRLDKRAATTTWIILAVVIVTFGVLSFFTFGEYLPAWFFSIVVAIIGLSMLSIPRSIRVSSEAVEIRCVVEITHIPYHHIKNARRIERSELPKIYPLFASCGFFGYFGYYLDAQNWDIIKVYITSWHGLVVIEDIYEQRYLVSTDRPGELVESIQKECERCSAE